MALFAVVLDGCSRGTVRTHGGDPGPLLDGSALPVGNDDGADGTCSATTCAAPRYATQALHIADFLLAQQVRDPGRLGIPDYADGDTANEDSNMEYALIGLAAAYWYSGDARYLDGLENGIHWLAGREDMGEGKWRGSWFYVYGSTAPYPHIPTSPGGGLADVRGVDATSGLFVYLLYLHQRLSGRADLAVQYAAHARAALDFVLTYDMDPGDPFSLSSWQLPTGADPNDPASWVQYRFQYTADQGDVYLGFEGGARLYEVGTGPYTAAAAAIRGGVGATFYGTSRGRYALGREGALDFSFDGFDGVFPQGYLAWVFGASVTQNEAAYAWLLAKVQPDGSLLCYSGDPVYTLSAAVLAMAATGLGQLEPASTLDWLVRVPLNGDGSVRDTAAIGSDLISNVAGFAIVALLGFPAFP